MIAFLNFIISGKGKAAGLHNHSQHHKRYASIFEGNLNMTDDEKKIYHALSKMKLKSISELLPDISFGRRKTIKLLKYWHKKI